MAHIETPAQRLVTATLAVIASTILIAATSCAPASNPSEQYGVVAAPPLPVETPAIPLDPEVAIADVDGSVVVDALDGVVTFRGEAGAILDATDTTLDGELRAVSADGTLAALFEETDDQASLITIVDRRGTSEPRRFELDGLIEPEAFSTDGELLYVIDHQAAGAPGAYRVRPFNMATGELETIVGPTKTPLDEDMNGTGRRQVWSPDGTRLNTLYIRQTHHHHDDAAPGDPHSHGEPGTDGFVHVLDLDDEWAHCLDLPSEFGGGELATTALAVSPDGATLGVADLGAGQIAFASSAELVVTDVRPFPDFAVTSDLYLGLSTDALILGSGTSAQWFDVETMIALSDPIDVGSELVGFTSNGGVVLAWTDDFAQGPRELRPPAPA